MFFLWIHNVWHQEVVDPQCLHSKLCGSTKLVWLPFWQLCSGPTITRPCKRNSGQFFSRHVGEDMVSNWFGHRQHRSKICDTYPMFSCFLSFQSMSDSLCFHHSMRRTLHSWAIWNHQLLLPCLCEQHGHHPVHSPAMPLRWVRSSWQAKHPQQDLHQWVQFINSWTNVARSHDLKHRVNVAITN